MVKRPVRFGVVYGTAALFVACGGGPEPQTPQEVGAAAVAQCLPEPIPAPAQVFVPSTSQVAAVLTVKDDDLQRLFNDAVPTTVARDENVKAGAAGRVSYEVKHGDVSYAHSKRGLEVSTPLKGEIQMCKPFGAVCFGYGKCHPEWNATLVVPNHITPFQTPHVDLDLDVRTGCVLSPVRYDATAELKKISQQQQRSIESQINREVGKYAKRLRASLADWGAVRSKTGQCVQLRPEQAKLAIGNAGTGEQRLHTLTAVTTGTVTADCDKSQFDPAFSVELSDEAASNTHVLWEQELSLVALERHLVPTETQTNPPVAATVRASGPELLIRLAPFGACGSAWGRFVPEVTPAGLSLRAVQVSDQALAQWVNARGLVFATETQAHLALADEVEQELRLPLTAQSPEVPAWKLVLTPALKRQHTARVAQNAVVLTTTLDGSIEARLQRTKN